MKELIEIYKKYPPHPVCFGKEGLNLRFFEEILSKYIRKDSLPSEDGELTLRKEPE